MDQRGPLCKHGPKYLRWRLMEAAIAASTHPLYCERYQRTKRRLGKQPAPRWRRSTSPANSPTRSGTCFAPAGAINRLAA
jgi:hypothetical protein